MPPATAPMSPSAFKTALLRWYDANKRPLPWRNTRDPYRIWVSEIMLQQTRVAAVIEHYISFLAVFPTLSALAVADEQQVLAQWSGLGYYRRARMLHAAAKMLAAERRRIPRTSEKLRKLPGIGRYTAAAIASISFGEPVAVVDGNVERVLQRISGGKREDPWTKAQTLLHPERPGDFNQAMMELGATVCMPRKPACTSCPVRRWCLLRGEHTSEKQVKRKKMRIGYRILINKGRIRLVQRPASSRLMPSMWELPQVTSPFPRTKPLIILTHSITTTDFSVSVWRETDGHHDGSVQSLLSTVGALPLTGLTRKILRRLDAMETK